MSNHADILREVRAEIAKRPEAMLDYLDALTLAANDRAEAATVRGQKGTWLGIAYALDRIMKLIHSSF